MAEQKHQSDSDYQRIKDWLDTIDVPIQYHNAHPHVNTKPFHHVSPMQIWDEDNDEQMMEYHDLRRLNSKLSGPLPEETEYFKRFPQMKSARVRWEEKTKPAIKKLLRFGEQYKNPHFELPSGITVEDPQSDFLTEQVELEDQLRALRKKKVKNMDAEKRKLVIKFNDSHMRSLDSYEELVKESEKKFKDNLAKYVKDMKNANHIL